MCTAEVTGAGGLKQNVAVSYSDNVNAGPVHVTASFAGDDNHNGSQDSEDFTIAKAGSTTLVTSQAGP